MPTGTRMDEGFSTIIEPIGTAGTAATALGLWFKEVSPFAVSGGGANDTTTMHNTLYRTRSPKKLKTLGESTGTAAYDPKALTDLVAVVNVNQRWRITYPRGDTHIFWGWLDEVKPNPSKEGEQPTLNYTIIPSNQDTSGAEVAPVYAAPA